MLLIVDTCFFFAISSPVSCCAFPLSLSLSLWPPNLSLLLLFYSFSLDYTYIYMFNNLNRKRVSERQHYLWQEASHDTLSQLFTIRRRAQQPVPHNEHYQRCLWTALFVRISGCPLVVLLHRCLRLHSLRLRRAFLAQSNYQLKRSVYHDWNWLVW